MTTICYSVTAASGCPIDAVPYLIGQTSVIGYRRQSRMID